MRSCLLLIAASLCATAPALAAPGDEVYRTHCSLCHDSGATRAPKLGHRADWAARIAKGRPALLESALKGVPDSAMLPKAGFAQLADADVIAATEYMLSTLGLLIKDSSSKPEIQKAITGQIQSPVDDTTLTARVAEALRARLAPGSSVDTGDGTRIAGIKVDSSNGSVTLSGMVNDGNVVRGAEEAARAVAGVTRVVNRLVGADLFEHD